MDKESRSKFCCPYFPGLAAPNCKGGYFVLGICMTPMITKTDEGVDAAFWGIFAPPGAGPAAPKPAEMQDV